MQTYQAFGNCFANISVREPQPRASEAFRIFGEMHRNMERDGVKMLKAIKPVNNQFNNTIKLENLKIILKFFRFFPIWVRI